MNDDLFELDDRPTLAGIIRSILADPFQFGMLAGAVAGALFTAFSTARRTSIRSIAAPPSGIQLQPSDQAALQRALETADSVVTRIVERGQV